ncbi:EAL and HDOD domain-containing protein [Acidocella aminolytica]|uniref:Diguanylate phosphodiesterase n=1 Tax=Acidocella aminolytica 101 = DSM 11237 TaxID=1120923 RepID=A0A0D6PL02_9PROT|nr:EAL domain-containing protein [Acidocella aminolytica]GAN82076.1 diguanylate phosphodiesterase [Acidocella aminolytica 101 = DSM 11237]GBQ32723.1 diguanylate phosphodiesterase [Acidocella aminolytica 101 = DSM 11237]SHF33787.1 EAL and modified HD-GYP domain-containing signal transduction protein [Acidocella aminolytica 101 = DSM 11237]
MEFLETEAHGVSSLTNLTSQESPENVFLGRQPILGRDRELIAYELLFRTSFNNAAMVVDDFAATAHVIDSAFLSLGIQQAIGKKTAFINVNADILKSDIINILPREQVVLEILEHVDLSDELIKHCQQMKQNGYRLALDDVINLRPEHISMLSTVDYVKFDIREIQLDEMRPLIEMAHAHSVKVIAEKVETEEEFQTCHDSGTDYFQGYFFARPTVISARAARPPRPILISLLKYLHTEVDVRIIESMIKGAPDLTVRLLRLANAVGMRSPVKISSIRGAILRVGITQIRRMVSISLLARSQYSDISVDPIVQAAAIRGHLMENLALAKGLSALREEAFMVGILSLAAPVFGASMTELLQVLDLDDSLREALVSRLGPTGELLTFVEACENFDAPESQTLLRRLSPAELKEINRMQAEAVIWASSL